MNKNEEEDAWLDGAFLAQEEYDRDKEKWKGREDEMNRHFLSKYDMLPHRREYQTGSSKSSISGNDVLIGLAVFIIGMMVICLFFLVISRFG